MSASSTTSRPRLREQWAELPREGRLLLGTVVADSLGSGFVLPFGAIYLHDVRDIPVKTVGVLMSLAPFIGLLLLGPIGSMIDRWGPRRLQMLALVLDIAGSVSLAFAHTPAQAGVSLALLGAGQAVFWPASPALVAAVLPSESRQRYYGVSFALVNLGIGLGGLISGMFVSVSHAWTFQAVYLVNALSFLVPLLVLAIPLRHIGNAVPPQASQDVAPPAASYRVALGDRALRRFLVVVFSAALVCFVQVQVGWVIYAHDVTRATPRVIAIAFAANTATIVLLQLAIVRRIEGRRRTRVLMLMGLTWSGAWALLGVSGLVPGSVVGAVLLAASLSVLAVGEAFQSPVIPAITNDLAPPHLSGRYNALAAVVFQAAAVVGPISGGYLLGGGHGTTYVVLMVAACGVMLLVLRWLERVIPDAANGVRPAPAPAADLRTDPAPVANG